MALNSVLRERRTKSSFKGYFRSYHEIKKLQSKGMNFEIESAWASQGRNVTAVAKGQLWLHFHQRLESSDDEWKLF